MNRRDLTTSLFDKSERIDDRIWEISYNKDKANAGQILLAVQEQGYGIIDVVTKEADLEDVFLNLTQSTPRHCALGLTTMSDTPPETQYDVVIIGSGAAGLTAAITLSGAAQSIGLSQRKFGWCGSTAWAQGGIAAVLEAGDTFDSHIEDTMVAGAGLNRRETVEFVVENAPAAIERLAQYGVPFNPGDSDRWHLTREGGHSHRRIVHVNDATGWAVQEALQRTAEANENITLMPNMVAIDLISNKHRERRRRSAIRPTRSYLGRICLGP